jgi:hypothetical protein
MHARARSIRGNLLIAALLFAAGAPAAFAQELSIDPKALDASGAASQPKGKKGAGKAQTGKAQGAAGGQAGKTQDRQFGELEGWSPGMAPPGKKEETTSGGRSSAPISVSPSGNMAVGLPF